MQPVLMIIFIVRRYSLSNTVILNSKAWEPRNTKIIRIKNKTILQKIIREIIEIRGLKEPLRLLYNRIELAPQKIGTLCLFKYK